MVSHGRFRHRVLAPETAHQPNPRGIVSIDVRMIDVRIIDVRIVDAGSILGERAMPATPCAAVSTLDVKVSGHGE